jgi:hypothetical protein
VVVRRCETTMTALMLDPRRDDLDGVVAAPEHHRVLFEDADVRVVESRISSGERTPPHRHARRRLMIALTGSSFARRDPDGLLLESVHMGDVHVAWGEPTGLHTIENTGVDDLRVVAVELLREEASPDA